MRVLVWSEIAFLVSVLIAQGRDDTVWLMLPNVRNLPCTHCEAFVSVIVSSGAINIRAASAAMVWSHGAQW